jgi:LPS-assembly lipoprotein
MKRLAPAVLLVLACLVTGCGFHLRGESTLPFETLNLAIVNDTLFEADLKRTITAGSKTQVVDKATDAQAVLQGNAPAREKVILSLSSAGRVSAYTLRYRFGFKVHDSKGRDFIPQTEIVLTREMTYSDAQVLAKATEEQILYSDMQHDMVQQVMRRLAAAKLEKAADSNSQ